MDHNGAFRRRLFECVSQYLKELKQKYMEREDCYKNLSSTDEMRAKLEELQKQMAWALVSSFTHESQRKWRDHI